jgi:hemerythrin
MPFLRIRCRWQLFHSAGNGFASPDGRSLAMIAIHQTEACELGVTALDRDHRQLFDLLARVQAPGWTAAAPKVVQACVDDLAHHLAHHFSREEMLMRLVGYPDAAQHRQSHAALLARLTEFRSLLRRNMFPNERFRDFLAGALLAHLREKDTKLKPWVDSLERPDAA